MYIFIVNVSKRSFSQKIVDFIKPMLTGIPMLAIPIKVFLLKHRANLFYISMYLISNSVHKKYIYI